MKVLKAFRVLIVFAVAACLTFYIAVEGMLIVGIHNNMSGNGGVMYAFLGMMLGLLAAPVAGGLAAVGVERLFKNCPR